MSSDRWWRRWPRRMGRQLADATAWARGRQDIPAGSTAFAYGQSVVGFLWMITIMTAVETAIVEVAVPWLWLRVALAVVCIGSLPLIAGTVAAYRRYPHLLDGRSVVIRCGRDWEIEVPLSVIGSAGRTLGTAPRRPGLTGSVLDLSVGKTDIVLTLRAPQGITVGGQTESFNSIRCSADDPAAFVQAIDRARQAMAVTAPPG